MMPLKFALCLTCLGLGSVGKLSLLNTLSSNVRQESGFISANVGDNVTLRCFYEGDVAAMFYWYKQTLGQKPKLISSFYKHDKNGTFSEDFKNNPRFSLDSKNGKNHLTIWNLQMSDSATYYCISCYAYKFEFAEGTTIHVKGSDLNLQTSVHQLSSATVQLGASLTLNCTVHTGTCDEEHSVYWFKSSEKSHLGLIYTHEGRNNRCERKTNTQTNTCVYNLPIKSLNLSDNGMYYCAVASCGHILFGNGTKLGSEDEVTFPDFLVHVLSGVLAFTTTLSLLMGFLVWKMNKGNQSLTLAVSPNMVRYSAQKTVARGYQDADNLHYAAVHTQKSNRQRRQMNDTMNHCVYSSVRQQI
uniref:Ig-like domain-containing protein n=1 Tax=Maylandia zebra TaxID=106582 RepID=A0A3P9BBL9_9CICH